MDRVNLIPKAEKDVDGMIQAMITLLCGIVFLVYIFRQQHYIQLQNEQIQKLREALSLREETVRLYKEVFGMMDKQAAQLKSVLRQEADHE